MIEKYRYNKRGSMEESIYSRSGQGFLQNDVLPVNMAQFCKVCSQRTKSLWCPPPDWQAGRWWWPARQRRRDSLWNNWSPCACGGSSTLQNKLNTREKIKIMPPPKIIIITTELHSCRINNRQLNEFIQQNEQELEWKMWKRNPSDIKLYTLWQKMNCKIIA